MRLILKATILSLTLFTFSIILNGCVEEPELEGAHRLSSVIRVVNVSNNQNNIKVTLDGQVVANQLAIASGTEFFDYPAGKKKMEVWDESGQLLYTKDVTIASLELMTLVIAGHYDLIPDNSTFSGFELSEGETYVSHAPKAGSASVYFVHGSAAVDTFDTKGYTVGASYTPTGETVLKDTSFAFETGETVLSFANVLGAEVVAGSYTFRFTPATGPVVTLAGEIEANFRYYMFLYGNPNNVQIYVDKVVPPPIRPRD
jgi:hypothetical protein